MAHDIFEGNMAFFGELPWHGIGRTLPERATLDDVLKAVSFYDVHERPVFAAGVDGPLPDLKALVASNDGRYLASVGADYGVVQFRDLYEPLVRALNGEVVWHTTALLGERGERAFLLAEFPQGLKVPGDPSRYRDFLMLYTGHDGSTAAKVLPTNVRVVCANTVAMALSAPKSADDKRMSLTVRHTRNAAGRVADEFGELLSTLKSRRETFGRVASFLQGVNTVKAQRTELLDRLIPAAPALAAGATQEERTAHERKTARTDEERGNLGALLEGKTGNTREIFGSVWGAFQACVEYADHHKPNRLGKADAATRLDAVIEGGPASWKAEAYQAVIDTWTLRTRIAEMVAA